MKKDLMIRGQGSSSEKMITAHASTYDSNVYIQKLLEKSFGYRMLILLTDGAKFELGLSEATLRAMRCALNNIAEQGKWDDEVKE